MEMQFCNSPHGQYSSFEGVIAMLMQRTLLLLVALSATLGDALGAQCTPRHTRCWLLCHDPPSITTKEEAAEHLRIEVNPELSAVDRLSGAITTPFKEWGLQGWIDYCLRASVTGNVLHAAESTDDMYTVDLQIDTFSVNGDLADFSAPSFVRIEIFGYLVTAMGRAQKSPPRVGDSVRVNGRLMWDGDGFLEVHPETLDDLVLVVEPPR
jgi:hypothetical protein